MPTYEYGCLDCGATLDIPVPSPEKEKDLKPVCPGCGGKNMVRFFGNINGPRSVRCGPSGGRCC